MQTTAGAVLRPSWRGIRSRSATDVLQRLRPNFVLPDRNAFLCGVARTRDLCGGVALRNKVTPARCRMMMSALSDGERRLSTLTAVGRPGVVEKVEQRRGVRTRMGRGLLGAVEEVKNPIIEKDLEFESPLDIVLYPDPRLRAKNAAVRKFDAKLEALCKEMFDVMYRTDGVGLSAPQVGVNYRVMVYNPEGVKGEGVEYVLVNPKIVSSSKKEDVFREGCLSFPEIHADVVRPLDVKVQAQNLQGKRFSLTLKGWKARIFQHEYDHLEGILYHDRMTEEVREEIREELLALEKAYTERTGQEPPETVQKG